MSTTAFYDRFERHARGEGLNARSTHYCPGCGHGLVHKYLADAIEHLGVADRTVAISPVGCAVFLYYYLDAGNIQAAHGRAAAVAVAEKLARPDSIVISYQGDGDLASIGIAEFLQAAQLGIPITVVFVNNAVYGMTGGQMAPTTLVGQRTTTSPGGRDETMGRPLRIAELTAQLDGPVYVERVALFDNKQRFKARAAIEKAVRLQIENRGFALIEVLAECPLHLGRTPLEAQRFVKEQMLPVFPLGVKKDATAARARWSAPEAPDYAPAHIYRVLGASREGVARFSDGFPRSRFGDDIALKLAGAGGDGAQTAAMIVAQTAINEGFDATHIPSYGPESRGGTSYADVRIAETEVLSPASPAPDVLVAFNAPSLSKFGPAVRDGGVVLYDRSVAPEPAIRPLVSVVGIPASQIAASLGSLVVKNVVMVGALAAVTGIFPEEAFVTAIRQALRSKPALLELNERAFAEGARAAREAIDRIDGEPVPGCAPCPRAQADGVPCDSPSADCAECPDAN